MDDEPATILLVDDEATLLKLMGAYLRRIGYAVIAVNTVEKAWASLRGGTEKIAVVVLDAGMAEEGVDNLALRIFEAHPHLRMVVNSGYPVDMRLLERVAAGRVMFLHKPFSPDMLVEAVRRMLGSQEKNV
jgi:DNA-binding NtrC family response regulator